MKLKHLTFFILLLSISCYNEVDIEAEWQDIPVVWAFLSKQDTAHYIRVERAFLTSHQSALDVAQNPDSLYYKEVEVLLTNSSSGMTVSLQKVDGNLEGYQREEGLFNTSPNYLYKATAVDIPIEGGDFLCLKVIKENGEILTSGSTRMVGDMELINGTKDTLMEFHTTVDNRLSRRPGIQAEIFNIRFLMHIEESHTTPSGNSTVKTYNWLVAKNIYPTIPNRVTFSFPGRRFFTFLSENLEHSPDVKRKFLGLDLLISSGGTELREVRTFNLANQYLTGSETLPFYTNMSNGRGIFSTRNHLKIEGLHLTPRTLDFLVAGSITAILNFEL